MTQTADIKCNNCGTSLPINAKFITSDPHYCSRCLQAFEQEAMREMGDERYLYE
jgi:hypothetical protein